MKKITLVISALLLCCDITLLFAAQMQGKNADDSTAKSLQELQALEQPVKQEPAKPAPAIPPQAAPAQVTPQVTPPVAVQAKPQAVPAPPADAASQAAKNKLDQEQQRALEQLQQIQSRQKQQISQLQGQVSFAAKPAAPAQKQAAKAGTEAAPKQEMVTAIDHDKLISEAAFQALIQNKMPMTAEQIVRFRKLFNASQFASATDPSVPPRPTATSQLVSLAPGSTPPVIRLAQGFVTSLVFLDSTGSPWPIAAYDIGDPGAFNIQWDQTSNTLMVQASKLYKYGNLAIRLKGLSTPVMLTLIPGQKAVDYRVDLRIQGFGPNAKAVPVGQNLPGSANPILLSVLDGVPPSGSTPMKVSGGDAQAWQQGSKLFLRTRLTVLSPGWIATMTSADGTRAYEMQSAPLLLASEHGKVMQLKVEGLS